MLNMSILYLESVEFVTLSGTCWICYFIWNLLNLLWLSWIVCVELLTYIILTSYTIEKINSKQALLKTYSDII